MPSPLDYDTETLKINPLLFMLKVNRNYLTMILRSTDYALFYTNGKEESIG